MPSSLSQSVSGAHERIAKLCDRVLPADVQLDHGCFAVIPGGSTILWLVGHMSIVPGLAVPPMIGIAPSVPAEWRGLFGMGTKASADGAGYPPYAEMRAAVIGAHRAVAARVLELGDDALLAELPDDFPLKAMAPTLEAFVAWVPQHSAYHLGQVTLLLRAQGLGGGAGR